MKNNFCLYFHTNPQKREVFYVGIGKKERPYEKTSRNIFWHRTVKKYGYNVAIVHTKLTWKEAQIRERIWIKLIGRKNLQKGTLVNLTDGGEGISGHIHSEEVRRKLSLSHMGHTPWNKGRKVWTEEQRKLIGERSRGRKASEETRRKLSESNKGKKLGLKLSEEHRKKISIAHIGKVRVFSVNHRLNLSRSRKGIKYSPETIEKMRLARNRYLLIQGSLKSK